MVFSLVAGVEGRSSEWRALDGDPSAPRPEPGRWRLRRGGTAPREPASRCAKPRAARSGSAWPFFSIWSKAVDDPLGGRLLAFIHDAVHGIGQHHVPELGIGDDVALICFAPPGHILVRSSSRFLGSASSKLARVTSALPEVTSAASRRISSAAAYAWASSTLNNGVEPPAGP